MKGLSEKCLISPGSGKANYVLLAEPKQMVLFDEETYRKAMQVRASSHRSAAGPALGLVLIVLLWLPIALSIWFFT